MTIPLFFSSMAYSQEEATEQEYYDESKEFKKIEGYDIIKEKMLPKCLEFKEADSLDMLKNQDPQLWLMCLEFIIDEHTSNKTK